MNRSAKTQQWLRFVRQLANTLYNFGMGWLGELILAARGFRPYQHIRTTHYGRTKVRELRQQ